MECLEEEFKTIEEEQRAKEASVKDTNYQKAVKAIESLIVELKTMVTAESSASKDPSIFEGSNEEHDTTDIAKLKKQIMNAEGATTHVSRFDDEDSVYSFG